MTSTKGSLKLSRLEYTEIVCREKFSLVYYDKNFEKYIMPVSRRPQEKLLPTYVPEYIVARKLTHEENFKQIAVSYMSWGAFDILIPQKINGYWV